MQGKRGDISLSLKIKNRVYLYNYKRTFLKSLVEGLIRWKMKDINLLKYIHKIFWFFLAVCVADGSSAQTFDNKTYPLNLEKDSWYVLMTSASKQRKNNNVDYKTQRQNNVTILVKQSGDNKKDVKIILNNGEHVIEMQPASSSNNNNANAKIQVNKKDQRASKNSVTEVTDSQNERIAQIYALPSGEVIVNIPSHGLSLNYDGSRVQVEANDRFRDGVRGLCGTFNGEKATDFTTPRNCVVRDAKDFVASYSLSSNNRDNSRLSNKDFCAPQKHVRFQQVINEKNTGSWSEAKRLNLQSIFGWMDFNNNNNESNSGKNSNNSNNNSNDSDNNNDNNSNNHKNSRRQSKKNKNERNSEEYMNDESNNSAGKRNSQEQERNQQRGSTTHRLMVVESENQLCFSVKAMPQCNQGYRAQTTVEKKVRWNIISKGYYDYN